MSNNGQPDWLITLKQRRDYLTQRIKAKKLVGWDSEYDERERDALQWAIAKLEFAMRQV